MPLRVRLVVAPRHSYLCVLFVALRTTRSVLTYNKNAAYEEELRKEEERRMYMRAQRSARKDDDLSPLDLEDDPSVAPFKRLRQLVKDSHVVKGRLRRVKVAKKSKKLDDLTDEEDSARTMMVPQDEATGGEEGSDVMVDEAVPEGVSENVLPIIEDGEEIDVEKVDEMLEQPLTETKAEEVLNRLPVKRPKIMRRRKICGSKGKRFIKMFAKRKRQNAKLRLLSAEGKVGFLSWCSICGLLDIFANPSQQAQDICMTCIIIIVYLFL